MKNQNSSDVLLFKLTSSPLLAGEVASLLKVDLSRSEVDHFADGEALARPLDSVRGKVVYIIQSTSTPVSERLMELLIFIDGLRNAKAEEINLVVPYYGFSRQDRIARNGEPITAKLVANLLETVGINRIITMDLHTPQIQGFFSCPVDDLSPTSLFGEYYRKKLTKMGIKTDKVTVVSPDHGSIHRARDLASELPNSKLAIIDKRRPAPNVAEVVNVVGDVKGQTCIIIDDIIDTAGTVLACTDALLSHGAKQVLVGGTHGVFSGDAAQKLLASPLKDIVITNSIERDIKGINVISIAPMIAGVIKASEQGTEVPDSWMDFY
jgi:ribose-phosphate pyrophosphokinase